MDQDGNYISDYNNFMDTDKRKVVSPVYILGNKSDVLKGKVSESIFNDLLSAKIKELLEDKQEQYDDIYKKVIDALDTKNPVTIEITRFSLVHHRGFEPRTP